MSAAGHEPRKRLSILGSTGSVGVQTLDVVAAHPGRFEVVSLGAGRNVALLAEQIKRFRPLRVATADAESAAALAEGLGSEAQGLVIEHGNEGLEHVATEEAELLMAGLVGAVGLRPTLAAVRRGRNVALANKEVLVMAGALVRREAERCGGEMVPVDSEHSAIFQSLVGHRREDVARIILTCSGGPFREWPAEQIARASVEEALNHPNWDMGAKITIDSASLMNKGLEVIEARWLFDIGPEKIDVVVHPESIVHSLVEYVDTSVIAQLGLPDMRVPIAVALAWPARVPLDIPRLDLAAAGRLHFETPDTKRFPCLELAFEALRGSEAAPAVLNAANEVSVAAFLAGEVPFGAIPAINQAVLSEHLDAQRGLRVDSLEEIIAADTDARERARELAADRSRAGGAPA